MTDRHPIFALSDRWVEQRSALRPILATFAGVPGHDHRWGDLSPAGLEAERAAVAEARAALSALPPTADPDAELALAVLRDHLNDEAELLDSDEPYADLNNITSTFQLLPMALELMDTRGPAGRADFEARLAALPEALSGYHARLAEGLRRGAAVSARQVRAAVAQGRARRAPADGGAPYFHRLAVERGVDGSAAADAAQHASDALTDWLEQAYLPQATPHDGVGAARYRRAARQHLGLSLDLAETYAWGWSQVRALEAALDAELARAQPGCSRAEAVARLHADPAWSAALPEPFLGQVSAVVAEATEAARRAGINVPAPLLALDVRLAPPSGKVGAYYSPPSEDLRRPGAIWVQPGARAAMPMWMERTTIVHEGIPGHHLQIGAQLLRGAALSRFQRVFAECTGHAEGWALYAEQLMDEQGFFAHPAERAGYLAGQLARAWRVVIDIGLHVGFLTEEGGGIEAGQPWTAALAARVLHERALLPLDHAEGEVVRYLGWPGQAIAYKVGQRVILDLRAAWLREGRAGGLPAFHARLLDMGAMGLGLLQARMAAAPAPPHAAEARP